MQQASVVGQEMSFAMRQLESTIIGKLDRMSLDVIKLTDRIDASHANRPASIPATAPCVSDNSNHPKADMESSKTSIMSARCTPCNCNCHAPTAVRTPQWLGSVFGSLLVSYSKTSSEPCRACSRQSCKNDNNNDFHGRYYFPPWLLHRMFSVQYTWSTLGNCNFALRTPRAVSSRSTVFTLAQHGNIKGMQRLFDDKKASPYDISIEEGRSALHVSSFQFSLCPCH